VRSGGWDQVKSRMNVRGQESVNASPNLAQQWNEALAHSGARLTQPRLRILEAIAGRDDSFTAEDLIHELSGTGVGRATVFRTIDLLSEANMLHRIHTGGCNAYVVCPPVHHHHVICSDCGVTANVDLCDLDQQLELASRQTGFAIDTHHLEFLGRCSTCRR
jgi:Fur family transcriptional regulator, ferric uptake regulator